MSRQEHLIIVEKYIEVKKNNKQICIHVYGAQCVQNVHFWQLRGPEALE